MRRPSSLTLSSLGILTCSQAVVPIRMGARMAADRPQILANHPNTLMRPEPTIVPGKRNGHGRQRYRPINLRQHPPVSRCRGHLASPATAHRTAGPRPLPRSGGGATSGRGPGTSGPPSLGSRQGRAWRHWGTNARPGAPGLDHGRLWEGIAPPNAESSRTLPIPSYFGPFPSHFDLTSSPTRAMNGERFLQDCSTLVEYNILSNDYTKYPSASEEDERP